jgi:Uma2 family endonuclease
MLWEYFRQLDPRGQVFAIPLDVVLDQDTVVQPDILYASGGQRDIFTETHVAGAPTLVVEILAPGSAAKNRVVKLPLYLKAGILHFWVVDPENRTMECMALQEGQYFMVAAGMENQRVRHLDFAGLVIDLGELWRV